MNFPVPYLSSWVLAGRRRDHYPCAPPYQFPTSGRFEHYLESWKAK